MANYARRDYKLARVPRDLEITLKSNPKYGNMPFIQSLRLVNNDLKNGGFRENETLVRLERKLEEMLYGNKKKIK